MKPTIEIMLDKLNHDSVLEQNQHILWYKSIYEEKLIPIYYHNIICLDDTFLEVEDTNADYRTIKLISIKTIVIIMKNENMVWCRKVKK